MSQINVPLRFVRAQLPTFITMLVVGIRSAFPFIRRRTLPYKKICIQKIMPPSEDKLIDCYGEWSGAPAGRYDEILPPHFCSHWAMAMLAKLGGNVPYNLLGLLNQGLRLQILQPIPRGKSLELVGELVNVKDDGYRARIHSRVVASVQGIGTCMTIDSYSVVVLKANKDGSNKKRPKKGNSASRHQEPVFETVGEWSVEINDGVNFGLLTGDFNPIHTVQAVGRRSRFNSCILHGFGQLARTYEHIQNTGYNISEIDIRWINPVVLPSQGLKVQLTSSTESSSRRALRLCGRDGTVHMVGTFS